MNLCQIFLQMTPWRSVLSIQIITLDFSVKYIKGFKHFLNTKCFFFFCFSVSQKFSFLYQISLALAGWRSMLSIWYIKLYVKNDFKLAIVFLWIIGFWSLWMLAIFQHPNFSLKLLLWKWHFDNSLVLSFHNFFVNMSTLCKTRFSEYSWQ